MIAGRPRPRPLPYPREDPPGELPSGAPDHLLDAALHGPDLSLRHPDRLPIPRWVGALAVGSVLGFLPWIVYLGFTLPAKVRAEHYDIAWLGFDSAMCTILAALAFCAIRRHAATGPIAAVASMMLIVDAWFDVFTSSASRGELVLAIVLAVCGELPLALLCGWVAIHAERVRTRAYRSLHLRWERALRTAEGAVGVTRRTPAAPPQR